MFCGWKQLIILNTLRSIGDSTASCRLENFAFHFCDSCVTFVLYYYYYVGGAPGFTVLFFSMSSWVWWTVMNERVGVVNCVCKAYFSGDESLPLIHNVIGFVSVFPRRWTTRIIHTWHVGVLHNLLDCLVLTVLK